jgi:hypothetical protein
VVPRQALSGATAPRALMLSIGGACLLELLHRAAVLSTRLCTRHYLWALRTQTHAKCQVHQYAILELLHAGGSSAKWAMPQRCYPRLLLAGQLACQAMSQRTLPGDFTGSSC